VAAGAFTAALSAGAVVTAAVAERAIGINRYAISESGPTMESTLGPAVSELAGTVMLS
jgi:hypothetical protein